MFESIKTNWEAVIVGVFGTFAGFYYGQVFTSWLTLAFGIFGWFLIFFVASSFAKIFFSDQSGKLFDFHRKTAYFLCACVLFAACWLAAGIISTPIEPGDESEDGNVSYVYIPAKPCWAEKEIYLNMFLALLTPTLLSVRETLKSYQSE